MTMRSTRWLGILALALPMLQPPTALASCMEPPPLEQHVAMGEAVFVGVVRQVTNQGRTAVVDVQEVWAGPDLPAVVTIRGGPDDPTMATSADRNFEPGLRYLFAVSVSDGQLQDSSCSATQAWHDELDQYRPTDVRSPEPVEGAAGTGMVSVPTAVIVASVTAAMVLAVSVLLFRRRP